MTKRKESHAKTPGRRVAQGISATPQPPLRRGEMCQPGSVARTKIARTYVSCAHLRTIPRGFLEGARTGECASTARSVAPLQRIRGDLAKVRGSEAVAQGISKTPLAPHLRRGGRSGGRSIYTVRRQLYADAGSVGYVADAASIGVIPSP